MVLLLLSATSSLWTQMLGCHSLICRTLVCTYLIMDPEDGKSPSHISYPILQISHYGPRGENVTPLFQTLICAYLSMDLEVWIKLYYT